MLAAVNRRGRAYPDANPCGLGCFRQMERNRECTAYLPSLQLDRLDLMAHSLFHRCWHEHDISINLYFGFADTPL